MLEFLKIDGHDNVVVALRDLAKDQTIVVDGNEIVLKHNYGCSQLGDDHENTRSILRDAVLHPNAGGVLVLGLGCENNNLYQFKESLGEFDEDRVKFLVSQEVSNEFDEGVKLLKEI